MRCLSIAALLALTAPEMVRPETLVYWECNGVVRETTIEEMAKIGCDSSIFTIADGGDPNPKATPYGQKTPRALSTRPPAGMALKWDESIGLLANNAYADISVWSVNCKGAKVCNAFEARDNGRTLFVIADGDGPAGVGGPCDLGKLVRAVKMHLNLQHPPESNAWTTCTISPNGFCMPMPIGDAKPGEDFNSWEVCGDEAAPNAGFSTPAYHRDDPKELRARADCIERRDAKVARMEKWKDEQRKKVEQAEADLKAQLSRCEPKR